MAGRILPTATGSGKPDVAAIDRICPIAKDGGWNGVPIEVQRWGGAQMRHPVPSSKAAGTLPHQLQAVGSNLHDALHDAWGRVGCCRVRNSPETLGDVNAKS